MRHVLSKVGSLKVAVVLLLALAGAMAAASFYEVRHGTEAALRVFYGSRWFAVLMAALGINVAGALLLRCPPRRSQAGFFLAHVSILAILAGALVTRWAAVHGSIWLNPDEAQAHFDGDAWALTLRAAETGDEVDIPIGPDGPVRRPADGGRRLAGVGMAVEQFAADTLDEGERVIADPNARHAAVKIRFAHDQDERELWVLGGQPVRIAGLEVRVHRVPDLGALNRLLRPASQPDELDAGKIVAQINGHPHVLDVEAHLGKTTPLGRTGYQVRLRRYLPWARVVGREILSTSSRPVNPMVEFDLIDSTGRSELHRLFARFPDRDFASMPRSESQPTTSATATTSAPSQRVTFRYVDATILSGQVDAVDLLLDPDGMVHARFADAEGRITAAPMPRDTPVSTPWEQTQLTLLGVLPHARAERALKPIPPRKQDPVPAVFICLSTVDSAYRMWVRRGESYNVQIGSTHVQVSYAPVKIPLGFSIRLIEPVITYYPGTRQARTYQSRVRIEDAPKQVALEQTIRMNAPLTYGGYTFYQSSYRFDRNGEPTASLLSVARDPGEPVVYVGYGGLMVGLLITLVQRLRSHVTQ